MEDDALLLRNGHGSPLEGGAVLGVRSPPSPGLVSTGESLHPQCCVSRELLAGDVTPTMGPVKTSKHRPGMAAINISVSGVEA